METYSARLSGYRKGVDVSEDNGSIDWEQVRTAGIEFAMLRAGYGRTADQMFARNAAMCNRLGIPCGVYWFSYAMTPEQAAQEAQICLNTILPYRIGYPVAFDYEYDSVAYAEKNGVSITMSLASNLAREFLRTVQAAGYIAVNYSNPDFLSRYFNQAVQDEFPLWLAQWRTAPNLDSPPQSCDIWQYSSTGRIPGIAGNVDLDVCYADYLKNGEDDMMTGEQIYNALNEYLESKGVPLWAEKELAEAVELGITDGISPTQLAPRYQTAMMAVRAVRATGLIDAME